MEADPPTARNASMVARIDSIASPSSHAGVQVLSFASANDSTTCFNPVVAANVCRSGIGIDVSRYGPNAGRADDDALGPAVGATVGAGSPSHHHAPAP